MTIRGHIHNGALVLDKPLALPEGSAVECIVLPLEPASSADNGGGDLYADLKVFIGRATGMPEDASEQVGCYLFR